MIARTTGLVLRASQYKEHDTILTLLTGDLGCITVIANAVRSVRSPHKGAVQPYTYSEYTLYRKGDFYHLRGSDLLLQPIKPGASLETLALCAYFSRLCEDACSDIESCRELLKILLNALWVASKEDRDRALVKGVFELRFLTLIGYMPDLFHCMHCGNDGENMVFDLIDGHSRCQTCTHEDRRESDRVISPGCLSLARRAVTVSEKEAYAVKAEGAILKEFAALCEDYTLTQMERGYPSLNYYHEICMMHKEIEKNV